jgi:DNA repair protein RadD
MTTTLRDYQATGVEQIRSAYRGGHTHVLYVAPTGSGKTVLFTFIATNAAVRGKRVCVLVHRRELLKQTCERLEHPHGVINAGFSPNPRELIQVATVQTLVHRLDRYHFDLLIVDEAHHCQAKTYRKILAANPAARVLGVTATPERLDGRGLGELFEVLIEGPSVADLTEAGYLAPAEVFAPSLISTEGVHSRAGDFVRSELAVAADRPRITGDVISHYRRHCDQQPAIAFCVSVEHAHHVAEAFQAAGYRAACVHANTPDRERDAALADLAHGDLHVVTNVDLFGEGVDVPVVRAGLLLRPTQSLGLALQQMGRCLRPAPGKENAIILDHAGNCLRHGLPDDPREWTLADKPRRKKGESADPDVAVRQCPSCFYCHRPRPTCPKCGFEYGIKGREVDQVEGELAKVERDPEQLARRREVGKAKDRAALEAIAAARGYRPGWVDHILRARGQRYAGRPAPSHTQPEDIAL